MRYYHQEHLQDQGNSKQIKEKKDSCVWDIVKDKDWNKLEMWLINCTCEKCTTNYKL